LGQCGNGGHYTNENKPFRGASNGRGASE